MSGQIIIHEQSDVLKIESGIIAHVVNDLGVMGAGIAKQIRHKWPVVYQDYRQYCEAAKQEHKAYRSFLLGTTLFVNVGAQLVVANCFGQCGIRHNPVGGSPFQGGAFNCCLNDVSRYAKAYQLPLHMPYGIGCGLAGGTWTLVRGQIERVCCQQYRIDVHLHKL